MQSAMAKTKLVVCEEDWIAGEAAEEVSIQVGNRLTIWGGDENMRSCF